MLRRLLPTALLAACFLVPASGAQDIDRTDFSAHATVYGAAITVADVEVETGPGLEIGLAYGVTPAVAVFMDVGSATMTGAGTAGDYTLTTADLGVRLRAFPKRPLSPHVHLAFTAQGANFSRTEGDLRYSGYGATLGVGLDYAISPTVAITAGLDGTAGEFLRRARGRSGQDLDGFDTQMGRLGMGVTAFL